MEKKTKSIFEKICDINENFWGNKRGESYRDELEISFLIEEALEGENLTTKDIASELHCENTPKEIARCLSGTVTSMMQKHVPSIDRFDKHLDSIYFNIGALHKLGLHAEDIVEGLEIVHKHNLRKYGLKDENGKIRKPRNFTPPEPELQVILDKRGIKDKLINTVGEVKKHGE